MSDELTQGRTLSVRLPMRLVTQLERLAEREANSWSAVARRLLAAGLTQADSRGPKKPSDAEARG